MLPSPLVRTNPVTGWKSLFGAAGQVDNGWIEGVTKRESEILKKYCTFHIAFYRLREHCRLPKLTLFLTVRQLISENHDLQVRFKWGTNDLAIWDK